MALEPITRQEKIIAGQDLTPITRMEKFLKNFGGGGGGGVQPDLSQTDTTKPDYVKGVIRQESLPEGYPYKEGSKTVIEWDGNTVGHEQAPYGGQFGDLAAKDGTYWHISDVVPIIEEMQSADCELLYGGQMMSGKVSDFGEAKEFGSFYFILENMAIVVKEPAVFEHEQNGYTITFPKAGVYLMLMADGGHIKKLAYGAETIYPMSPEFLPALTSPNGTKYKLTVSDDGTLSAVAQS